MAVIKQTTISNFSDAARIDNFRLDNNGTLKKREGCFLLKAFGTKVRGAVNDYDTSYFVTGTSFYSVSHPYSLRFIGYLEKANFADDEGICMFIRGDIVYMIGGGAMYQYNKLTDVFSEMPGYSPYIWHHISSSIIGNGDSYEVYNMFSNRVRCIIRPSTDYNTYALYGTCSAIDNVIVNGVIAPERYYVLEAYSDVALIRFTRTDYLQADYISVEYVCNELDGDSFRDKYLHNVKTYVYEGADATRLFIYGGELGAKVLYSEVSSWDPFDQQSTLDYFPPHTSFTVGDGTKPVTAICSVGGRTIIATEHELYEPVTEESTLESGITIKLFSTKQVKADFGMTASCEGVSFEDKLYLISERGLFTLEYDKQTETYVSTQIEFAEYATPSNEELASLKLFLNSRYGELWCYNGTVAYVYNLKSRCWYRFSCLDTERMLMYGVDSAFYSDDKFYIYASDSSADETVGVDAVYESKPIALGDIFKLKTLLCFGASYENAEGSKLECTLISDKGTSDSIVFTPDVDDAPTPAVSVSHARFSNIHHITCRITSPSTADNAALYSLMFGYIEREG